MNYIVTNLILFSVFFFIAFAIKKEGNKSMFIGVHEGVLMFIEAFIFPIIITVVNLSIAIGSDKYSYIGFTLIPLLIPIGAIAYGNIKHYFYSKIYDKYHDTIVDNTKKYLKGKEMEVSSVFISFNDDFFCKKVNEKIPCMISITLKNDKLCSLETKKGLKEYLNNTLTELAFRNEYESK